MFSSKNLTLALVVALVVGIAPASLATDSDGEQPRVQVIRECRDVEGNKVDCAQAVGAAGHRVKVMVLDSEGSEDDELVWESHGDRQVHRLGDGHRALSLGDMSKRGFLGISLVELTPELRVHFGSFEESGVMVGRVETGSPADQAGIDVGDILTSIDGDAMRSTHDVVRTVRGIGEGESAAIELVRDSRTISVSAIIAEREGPEVDVREIFLRRDGDGNRVEYEFDSKIMADSIHKLQEHFSSPDFRSQILTLQDLEGQLQRRLEKLEKRLEELEDGVRDEP